MALFAKLLSHIAQRLHMSDKAKTYLDLHQVYVSRIDGTHSSLLDFVAVWFLLTMSSPLLERSRESIRRCPVLRWHFYAHTAQGVRHDKRERQHES
jgi:hypothetical protein